MIALEMCCYNTTEGSGEQPLIYLNAVHRQNGCCFVAVLFVSYLL